MSSVGLRTCEQNGRRPTVKPPSSLSRPWRGVRITSRPPALTFPNFYEPGQLTQTSGCPTPPDAVDKRRAFFFVSGLLPKISVASASSWDWQAPMANK